MREHHHSVILVGAGIAGLWSLRRLLAAGYDAVLLESGTIGGGQTLAAQGILHGGVKYGLDGSNRGIAELLRSLPPVWLSCMEGRGELDLSAARVTSPVQHMWAADSWLARVGATVGARAMQGEVRKLERGYWPTALRDGGHRGSVYEISETVIDTKSVIAALCRGVEDRILHAGITAIHSGSADGLPSVEVQTVDGPLRLTAGALIFTAATGNEAAAEALGLGHAVTQRRPLRMIMARGALPTLWGHCVTVSPKPVATVTTHPADGGGQVWYIGGNVAEQACTTDPETALRRARAEIAAVFPAMAWEGIRWAWHDVDRAEPAAGARLPEGPALLRQHRAALAWPAKLVYAPALAAQVLEFSVQHTAPSSLRPPPPLPRAVIGSFPWEICSWVD